jgi:hypothetical protein
VTTPPEAPTLRKAVQRWRALDARVGALESKLRKKDGWDILATLSPFLTAIVIFIVTFILKDSVEQAFNREQLHLSSVKDMQELVLTLRKPDVTKETASASAMTLAAFGHHAIPALLSVFETADEVRAPAAEEALSAIGSTEPVEVCRPMTRILQDTNARYSFLTHEAALRIIEASECADARPVVTGYDALLQTISTSDLPQFGKRFTEQTIGRDDLKDLKDQSRKTLQALAGR